MHVRIAQRLRKLEAQRRPDGALHYLLWVTVPEEIGPATRAAIDAGTIRPGDMVVSAVWNGAGKMLASRWVSERQPETAAEMDGLRPMIEEAAARPDPYGRPRWHRDITLLSDAVLVTTVLGVAA